MELAVTPVDVTDERDIARAYEVYAAAVAVDVPDFPPVCPVAFAGGLRHPWPGCSAEHLLARVGDEPVGYLSIELPELDNTDNIPVEIHVHPAHRRRGYGRALHELAMARAREVGRRRLMSMTVGALPGGPARHGAGEAFAAAMGASSALAEVRRRLDVSTVDPATLEKLHADAQPHMAGYSILRWQRSTPQDVVADVAYLEGRMVTDSPMGDLAWEPEKVDADRIQAVERVVEARGQRIYCTGARHAVTGRLVAWTVLTMDRSHLDWADQGTTIVDPDHRGHRLGIAIKIENLWYAQAHEPGLRYVDTWNAAENEHMIAINEAMGFRAVDRWDNWQQDV